MNSKDVTPGPVQVSPGSSTCRDAARQLDTFIGSVFTAIVAIFCVIMTGTLLLGVNIGDAGQAAQLLMGINPWVGTLLAIGLLDAGFLGAVCISLASSWAFGEVFGWAHSLNFRVREATWFYAIYFIALVTAGSVVLIPGAPLVLITLFVQVAATILLPAALVFLILLLNSEEVMGRYRNTQLQNIVSSAIVIAIIIVSTLYGISTLFPGWLG